MSFKGVIKYAVDLNHDRKVEHCYLIELNDGDRIWRWESELEFEDVEKEKVWHETKKGYSR